MPTQQANANSTPAPGTGSGGGLRGAAGQIAGMLSDDFTITDTGHDGGEDRGTQHQTQRREPREGQRQAASQHDENEPVHRGEEVEEIDDEGNVRYRENAGESDEHDEGEELGHEHDDDDPEGQQEPKTGELKDDTEVTIAVGGDKTEKVTFGELKKGYLRQADYTRKTQALTTERTEFQKTREDVNAERTSLTASIEAVGRFVKELIPQEPTAAEWENLRQRDPNGYAAAREEWRTFKERLQGVEVAFRNVQHGQTAEQQRVIRELASKEKAKLEEVLPEWTDPRVKKRDVADIFEAAKKLGFTDDDVKNTVDHRLMLLCLKAAKYDRLMAAKKSLKTDKRGKSAPTGDAPRSKVLEPGSKGNMPTRKTAVTNARDNHHKSQNVRSGAALIEKLL
jgi:hypothetical protein